MTNQQPVIEPARARAALVSLCLCTFVMGSAELVVVGILPAIARAVHVDTGDAGAVVTAYALGIALGAPVLSMATSRIPWRRRLFAALGGYTIVSALTTVSANFAVLIVLRGLAGCLQGVFLGAAFTVATALVPAQRAGRAIATVFGGIALSSALGAPLGTLVGQTLGWRGTFLAITVAGAVSSAVAVAVVPRVAPPAAPPARGRLRSTLSPALLAVLAVGLLLMGGQFAALTYLAPLLSERTGLSGTAISAFVMIFGVACAVGTFGGGVAADRNAARTILGATVVLVCALAALPLASTSPPLVALCLTVWGVAGFGFVPSLQHRVHALAAGHGVAATLPASAVNIGIAMGSVVGGWALDHHGVRAPAVTALALCGLAVPLSLLGARTAATGIVAQPAPRHQALVSERIDG